MIILAHVNPPPFVFQLRNFDVPLMVLVSGAAFATSFVREAYTTYVWKRIKRLLFPVWIFLTVYFVCLYGMSAMGWPIRLPDPQVITTSYLLLSGIGYVWIIRVFLLVALAAPAIHRFDEDTPSNQHFFLILGVIYIAYELILIRVQHYISTSTGGTFVEYTVFYLIPYAIVFAVGIRLLKLSRSNIFYVALTAITVFLTLMLINWYELRKLIPTQQFKYPPSAYYLSYALYVSCLVWLSTESGLKSVRRLGLLALIMFIGRNSLWIYLWHIPLIEAITLPFYLKYPVVFAAATLGTFLQVTFAQRVLMLTIDNSTLKRNLRLIFAG